MLPLHHDPFRDRRDSNPALKIEVSVTLLVRLANSILKAVG